MFIYKMSYIYGVNMNGNGCGCESESWMGMRNFLTKEEKIDILKEYKEKLDKEAKGVAEKIKELQQNN